MRVNMMTSNIIFLSQYSSNQGSGVGDYCGLLSDSLQYHSFAPTTILSWNESHPNWPELLKPPPEKGVLSIQFVPYSFGRWGFFLPFLRELIRVKDHWHIHLMFHEIWIGDYPDASLKDKLIGKIQKWLILKMIREAQPIAIHTTNAAYLYRLKKAGVDVDYLPMFGTVPVANFERPSEPDKNSVKIALFGSCHSSWPWKKLIQDLKDFQAKTDKAVEIHAIGGLGKQWNDIKAKIKSVFDIKIHETGFLEEYEISQKLQSMDLAVSSTPLDILGKSSSAATLLEHGLPLIVHDDGDTPDAKNWIPDQYKDQIFLLEDNPFNQFAKKGITLSKKPRSGLEDTARMFIEDLQNGMAEKSNLSTVDT